MSLRRTWKGLLIPRSVRLTSNSPIPPPKNHFNILTVSANASARLDHGSSQQQLQSNYYSQNQSRINEPQGGISSSSSQAQPVPCEQGQSSSLPHRSSTSLRPRHVTGKMKMTASAPKKKKKVAKVQERGRIDYKKELLRGKLLSALPTFTFV